MSEELESNSSEGNCASRPLGVDMVNVWGTPGWGDPDPWPPMMTPDEWGEAAKKFAADVEAEILK